MPNTTYNEAITRAERMHFLTSKATIAFSFRQHEAGLVFYGWCREDQLEAYLRNTEELTIVWHS